MGEEKRIREGEINMIIQKDKLKIMVFDTREEMGNKAETTENLLENKVDPNIREKDTLEYKKIYFHATF